MAGEWLFGYDPEDQGDEPSDFDSLSPTDRVFYLEDLRTEAGAARSSSVSTMEIGSSGLRMLTTAEMLSLPEQAWLVQGLIPEAGFVVMAGRNQVGKTFQGLDLAAHLSLGTPWFGLATVRTRVLYVALEGMDRGRVSAWLDHHDVDDLPDLAWVQDGIDLKKRRDQDKLVALARGFGAGLVIVDTLNRSVSGFDENGSSDMAAVIGFADRLRREAEAGLMVIHHSPRTQKYPRGHSSLEDAADTVLFVVGSTNPRHIEVRKQRNAPLGRRVGFRIEQHPGGGAIVVPVGPTTGLDQLAPKEHQLVQALVQEPALLPATHTALKQRAVDACGMAESTFSNALKALVAKGILAKNGEEKGAHYEWTEPGRKLVAALPVSDSPR